MNKEVFVAGLKFNSYKLSELKSEVLLRLKNKTKTYIVTPYSEFLYHSLRNVDIMRLFNKADISLPDGIGIFWADYFLSFPLTFESYFLKILQAIWQVVYSGASIIFNPKKLYKNIPEKISGSDFIWDLAQIASENNFSIFLLGGFGNVTNIVEQRLKEKFPNLKIVGKSNLNYNDPAVIQVVKDKQPDILLVAFGPINQEQWINENLKNLPVTLAIGVGGSFDYIAGEVAVPPKWIRGVGLEWLFRLITQPSRWHRIYLATYGLARSLVRYKVFGTMPLRENAVAVVINQQNKVLLCKRIPGLASNGQAPIHMYKNYWQLPQGGVEKNENYIVAAQRELYEETGLSEGVKFWFESKHSNSYDWHNVSRSVLVLPRYRYRGQIQKTFYFKFEGLDTDVKIDQHEFEDYKWLSLEDAERLIAEERKPHFKNISLELSEKFKS